MSVAIFRAAAGKPPSEFVLFTTRRVSTRRSEIMKRLPLLALFLLAGCSPIPGPVPGEIDLHPIAVADFDKQIEGQRGKVVFVDVWFFDCGPCRSQFPHTVALHRKFAEKGLVVMTVDVVPDEWKKTEVIVGYLKSQKADFSHYIFRDKPRAIDDWQAKHGAERTPTFLMFDRNGKKIAMPLVENAEALEEFVAEHLD